MLHFNSCQGKWKRRDGSTGAVGAETDDYTSSTSLCGVELQLLQVRVPWKLHRVACISTLAEPATERVDAGIVVFCVSYTCIFDCHLSVCLLFTPQVVYLRHTTPSAASTHQHSRQP